MPAHLGAVLKSATAEGLQSADPPAQRETSDHAEGDVVTWLAHDAHGSLGPLATARQSTQGLTPNPAVAIGMSSGARGIGGHTAQDFTTR